MAIRAEVMFQGISQVGLVTLVAADIQMLFLKPEICLVVIETEGALCQSAE